MDKGMFGMGTVKLENRDAFEGELQNWKEHLGTLKEKAEELGKQIHDLT